MYVLCKVTNDPVFDITQTICQSDYAEVIEDLTHYYEAKKERICVFAIQSETVTSQMGVSIIIHSNKDKLIYVTPLTS